VGKGVSQSYFLSGIIKFLRIRSPCKVSEPYDNPFWKKSNAARKRERKKERKKEKK
jgi:hypothetical protein